MGETAAGAETTTDGEPTEAVHPLEPLTPEEISRAAEILRREQGLGERARFSTIELHEPAKAAVLDWPGSAPVAREAFAIVLDRSDGRLYEAIVALDGEGRVSDFRHVPGAQPRIMAEEFEECEEMLKRHPEYLAALAKRGIAAPELLMIDPWSAGSFDGSDTRLLRGVAWVRSEPGDNGYARPVEGLVALVDLNRMEVVRIEDHGVTPLPPEAGDYRPEAVGPLRDDVRPLEITQPDGPSFQVDGHEISWQKWRIRIGFTAREGLVLHTVSYQDGDRRRPVIYRASFSEMVVPYGDVAPTHAWKNAFDIGEYGLGALANALELGCDCLGEIHYFDAVLADAAGHPQVLPNAICLHEEDASLLWKHMDWRTGQTEVRRSRRLVLSFVATVGNYEYAFYWYFQQDGTIESEVKLTGILSTGAVPVGEQSPHATLVAPGLTAPYHQHFFNVRLDMMVDGTRNSVIEVDTEATPAGPQNPLGNAFTTRETVRQRGRQRPSARPEPGPLLEGRQPDGDQPDGHAGGLQARARAQHRSLRPGGLVGGGPVRLHHPPRVGDPLRPDPALRRGGVPQPARGRRRPADVDRGRPADGERGHRPLVHDGPPSHSPPRGLAGHARGADRLCSEAGRVLRAQSGAGRAAARRGWGSSWGGPPVRKPDSG